MSMFAPDLHSLGFDFNDWPEMKKYMAGQKPVAFEGLGEIAAFGLFRDPSGAGIAFYSLVDFQPWTSSSLDGIAGHRVEVVRVNHALALVDVYDEDDDLFTRFFAAVNDPIFYPFYELGSEEYDEDPAQFDNYQLSAVALDHKIHEDVEAFKAATPSLGGLPGISCTFIACPSLFEVFGGDIPQEEATPECIFNGVFQSVELRTNEMTGNPWYYTVVDCGFPGDIPVALAIPADTPTPPTVGGVFEGRVLMLGSSGFWDQYRDLE